MVGSAFAPGAGQLLADEVVDYLQLFGVGQPVPSLAGHHVLHAELPHDLAGVVAGLGVLHDGEPDDTVIKDQVLRPILYLVLLVVCHQLMTFTTAPSRISTRAYQVCGPDSEGPPRTHSRSPPQGTPQA